jgi:hypothetical protein
MEHIKEFSITVNIVLGVDVDGVQNDFVNGYFDVYAKNFPDKKFDRNVDDWFFYEKVDLDGKDPLEYFLKTRAEGFEYSNPYDGAPEAMKRIYKWCKDNNIVLKIITNQPTQQAKENVIEWLKRYNIPYDDLIFAKERYKFDNCDILIDDSHLVINEKPNNKVSIKVNRGWNKGS